MQYLDGTFKFRPLLFSQLYVIHYEYQDHVVLEVFVLMNSKSEHAYRAVFTSLQQSLPADHRHGLEHFSMDFELMSSTAIKPVFPEKIQEQRRLQEAGHSVAYMNEENSELCKLFHSMISLSRLPPDDVLSAFDLTLDNCLDELDVVINKLEEYYVRSKGEDAVEENTDSR